MKRWLFVLSVSLIILGLIILTNMLGIFDAWSFMGMLFYTIIMSVFILYINYDYNRRMYETEKNNINRKSLSYCWQRINSLLKEMPDGDTVEWSEGFGKKTELKSYTVDGVTKTFRSIVAHLVKNNQLVVIIYSIDDDYLARYYANPTPGLLRDPFLDFNPGGTTRPMGMGDQYGGRDRFPIGSRGYPYNYSGMDYNPQMNQNPNTKPFETLGEQPKEEDAKQIIDKLGDSK